MAQAQSSRDIGIESADRIVAVASNKGGVGKTTTATHLASALAAKGEAVGLFDADIHGPNVPELLSVEGPVHATEDGHPQPIEVGGLQVMSVGFMSDSAPLAWRGAVAHDALSEFLDDTAWDDPETIVLDLPPGTGDIALTTLQEVPVDGVVFVTTPFSASIKDTNKSIQLFRDYEVPILGVVRNMEEFVCDECETTHSLFAEATDDAQLDAPVLTNVPFDLDMQRTPAPDDDLPGYAHELATAVTERLEDIWNVELPENSVDLRGDPADERKEKVRSVFTGLESGDPFYLVSDRDPTSARDFLLQIFDGEEQLEYFEVRQKNPETWILRTVHP